MRNLVTRNRGLTNTFFDDFFRDFEKSWTEPGYNFTGGYDVEETDKHFLVTMDLPGVSKDDININININLDDNILKIHAVRDRDVKDEENGKKTYGRFYGEFTKSFSLPNSVDADDIQANYENGVLHIALPKKEASNGKRVEIQEGKSSSFWDKLITKKSEDKKLN